MFKINHADFRLYIPGSTTFPSKSEMHQQLVSHLAFSSEIVGPLAVGRRSL